MPPFHRLMALLAGSKARPSQGKSSAARVTRPGYYRAFGWSGRSARCSGVPSDQAGSAPYPMQGTRGSTAGDEMRSASVRLRTPLAPEVWPRSSQKERKMLRGAFRRCGVITAIAFSAAMFISDARFNVAEAQGKPRAEDLACGKELQELCSGLATLAFGNQWPGTKIPNCLAREKAKLSKRCAARAANIVKSCGADVRRRCAGNVTGQGNILACLTMARGVVSAGCNAALDAAYLR